MITPKVTARAAPAAHQQQPKRRMANTSTAPGADDDGLDRDPLGDVARPAEPALGHEADVHGPLAGDRARRQGHDGDGHRERRRGRGAGGHRAAEALPQPRRGTAHDPHKQPELEREANAEEHVLPGTEVLGPFDQLRAEEVALRRHVDRLQLVARAMHEVADALHPRPAGSRGANSCQASSTIRFTSQ